MWNEIDEWYPGRLKGKNRIVTFVDINDSEKAVDIYLKIIDASQSLLNEIVSSKKTE